MQALSEHLFFNSFGGDLGVELVGHMVILCLAEEPLNCLHRPLYPVGSRRTRRHFSFKISMSEKTLMTFTKVREG